MDDLLDDPLGADDALDPDDEYDPREIAPFPLVRRREGVFPDLREIPAEQWQEALRPYSPSLRLLAIERLDAQRSQEAHAVLIRLGTEDQQRREEALVRSAPPDVGRLPRPILIRREVRQVSFRLSLGEHDELRRAAAAYGVSNARLARMLTIRGVRRALRDP
jgi:hypothetical protein